MVILGEINDDDEAGGDKETVSTTPQPDMDAINLQFEAFVERMKTDTPDPIVRHTFAFLFQIAIWASTFY